MQRQTMWVDIYQYRFKLIISSQQSLMEVERHLFRVAERAFKNSEADKYCWMMFGVSITVLGFFLFSFGYVSTGLNTDTHLLNSCYKNAKIQIANDQIWSFYFDPLPIELKNQSQSSPSEPQKGEEKQSRINPPKEVYNGPECRVFRNLPLDSKGIGPDLQFTRTRGLLSLTLQQRKKLDIENYTFILHYGLLQKTVLEPVTLLYTQISKTRQLAFKDRESEDYPYANYHRSNLYFTDNINSNEEQTDRAENKSAKDRLTSVLQVVYRIFKVTFFFMLISIATSMYIYGTIISAPAVIIMILSCTRFGRPQNMTEVYRIFPWIGLHVLIKETSQSQLVRSSAIAVCCSLLFYFFVIYLIYYAIIFKSNWILFDQTFQPGIEELFFSFNAIIEFASIVFMRTRPFIKYYPKIHTLLIIGFLLYCSFAEDGCKKLVLWNVIVASLSLFCWMCLRLEIPAHNIWSTEQHYTPTIDRPRVGMAPIFNMSWINDLPEQWTRFIPLQGRQKFDEGQLALVDRDFQRLNAALQVPH